MNDKFRNNLPKIIFVIVAVAIAISMFCTCLDYGSTIAEDEYRISQGVQLDRYYRSFGDDKSILENTNPQYSGWFNALTVFAADVFSGCEFRNVRQAMNSVMGFLGILFAGFLAKRYRSWRAGSFAMILLGLCPLFLAHSGFNFEDIPVATTFVATLYFIKRLADHFPTPKISDIILFTISSALCISANPECSFIVVMAVVAIVFGMIAKRKSPEIKKAIIRYSVMGISSLVVIFLICILLVPAFMQSPFSFSNWVEITEQTSPSRILFQGKLYWTDLLPWYYNVKMIAISIPIVIFIGAILSLGLCFAKKTNRADVLFLLAIVILGIIIFSSKTNTNGIWQHLLYAVIPLFIMATIGFDILVETARTKITKTACTFLPVILMIMPVAHIIRNHPYEHIYFNEFIGGTSKALGKYELENFGICNRQAAQWIIDNGKYKLSGNQLFVGMQSEPVGKHYFGEYKSEVSIVKTNWAERANHIWDYAIFPITGIEPEILTGKFFPPKNTVDTIFVDDIPICLVLQRTDTCDLYGRGFLANNDVLHAIELLESAVNTNLTNESAMINLIDANMRINNKAEMKKWIDRYLEISPRSDIGNYFNALYHNITGETEEAKSICNEIIENNPRYNSAYLLLSTIQITEKNFAEAENTVLSLVDFDVYNEDAARQLVRVYNAQKKDIRDAEISYYNYAYKSYENRGKKDLAKKYKQLYDNAVAERNK